MSGSGLPRLLAAEHASPAEHPARGELLIEAVATAGLRGRGGAGFPTAVKLRAVAERRGRRAVVVNGAEGEPMGAKDRVLLAAAPHLVLDGVLLAAEAVGARDVVIALKRSAGAAHQALECALAEREGTRRVRLQTVPDAFLAGEESALINGLNGGAVAPTLVPPRPYERGLGRRPTLVSNVETFAHVALIARHGAGWFREVGEPDHPGSALITLAGAVERPGVYEIALGTPIAHLLGPPASAVLVGGYYGAWLTGEEAASATLDDPSLAARRAAVGAGVVVALPAGACGVAEVARVLRYLADESAGQCGPCVHGLDAIAGAFASLSTGTAREGMLSRLERWCGQVDGRGACHHPNGAVRFLRSALRVFAGEIDDHRRHGRCDSCGHPPVLRVPDARRLAA